MTLGFNIPEYCTHPKHATQTFLQHGPKWMCTIYTHTIDLLTPKVYSAQGREHGSCVMPHLMKLHMQIWTQKSQFQQKEISVCSFSASWWALRTTEDLFSFPLASCPTNFAHSQPWCQLLIVFWCFCRPITALTVWQPKHGFVFSFFPCTPSTQSNRHTNFHPTGECF